MKNQINQMLDEWGCDEIRRDRRKACMDSEANMYTEWVHKYLSQLSKPELIDLVANYASNDYSHGVNAQLDDILRDAIIPVLCIRYFNRHPEKI